MHPSLPSILLPLSLAVCCAFLLRPRPIPSAIPPDPFYAPHLPRSCQPPPLRTRPFAAPACLLLAAFTHTTATVRINPPTNSSHTLHGPHHQILTVAAASVHTFSHLTPDSRYTLNLRAPYTVCTLTFSTRPSALNYVLNPSFESVAHPPFLASTFRPAQRDSPAFWTPFYNGGARRRCGLVPLSPDAFAFPKAGNCLLFLGPLPDHPVFDHSPRFYGAHQSVITHHNALILTFWYITAPSMQYRPDPQSLNDSLSVVISCLFDDATHSHPIVIPLKPVHQWTPLCISITAPPRTLIHTLHIFFHMHDFHAGALLVDDVSVVNKQSSRVKTPYLSPLGPDKCHSLVLNPIPTVPPAPVCTHLTATVRPHHQQLTIAVPLTTDRILRLEAMSRMYAGGPIVAAVMVRDMEQVEAFRAIWSRKKWLRSHVDVMFVRRGDDPIPINALRNIAVQLATTNFLVMLDVDMTPATHAFSCFRDERGNLLNELLPPGEKRILTLPVFIAHVHHRSARDKNELVNMLRNRVGTSYCINSQKSNKIKRWYKSFEATETRFTTDYEPYGIVRRDVYPMYDERFSGYGFNKIAWAMKAESAGWKMFVLPEHFVTHLNHVENEWVSSIDVGHYLQTWRTYMAFVAEAWLQRGTTEKVAMLSSKIPPNCTL